MKLNNYEKKSESYSRQTEDQGTIKIAYQEFGVIFDKYVTSSNNKAIDYGCGTGRSRRFLETMGFDADGVDIDESMIEKAREIDGSNKYQLISEGKIQQRKSKYDLAFSALVVLELHSRKEIEHYFSECYRVIKFDGTFVVLTVNDDFYKHQWASIDTNYPGNKNATSGDRITIKLKEIDVELHDYYWKKEDFRNAALATGFTILEELEPKAKDDHPEWISEKEYAPYVIFVMKKTESLIKINEVAKNFTLDTCMPGKGFFRETERSNKIIKKSKLPECYTRDRNKHSTLMILMEPGNLWPFHRLKSKETFSHIKGNDILIHCVFENGDYKKIYLGDEHDIAIKKFIIPDNCWHAQEVVGKKGYSIIEAKTSPAFDIDDMEEVEKNHLLRLSHETNNIELTSLINRIMPSNEISSHSRIKSESQSIFNKSLEKGDNICLNVNKFSI